MAKAMQYPEVFRILLEGGYIASSYYAHRAADHAVHAKDGSARGHITGSQVAALLGNGILEETNRSKPEKGIEEIVFLKLRRRHGFWIDEAGDGSAAECSECRECYDTTDRETDYRKAFELFCQFYKFCPCCGAEMETEAGEDDGTQGHC